MGLHQLGELQGLLAAADIKEESHNQRRKQVDRLMLNLKKAKHLAWIRNKYGSFGPSRSSQSREGPLQGDVPHPVQVARGSCGEQEYQCRPLERCAKLCVSPPIGPCVSLGDDQSML